MRKVKGWEPWADGVNGVIILKWVLRCGLLIYGRVIKIEVNRVLSGKNVTVGTAMLKGLRKMA